MTMVKTFLFGVLLTIVFVAPWSFIVEKNHIQADLAFIVGFVLGCLGMSLAFWVKEDV